MSHLDDAVTWLRSIGLNIEYRETLKAGFLEHVRIYRGNLIIDDKCSPSNLIHEAAHLAVIPGKYRKLANDDLYSVFEKLMNDYRIALNPDGAFSRAAIQSGEAEAIAWSWAAGKAIGLPESVIIEDQDYDGEGRELRFQLTRACHFGVHGLAHAGFCSLRGEPKYPNLRMWLQREFEVMA